MQSIVYLIHSILINASKKSVFNDWFTIRNVNFGEFHFSIQEFQSLRLVEYSKVTWQLAWMMHLMRWMLQLSRYHAMRLWLGGGPWEVERRDGREAVAVSNYKARLSLSCTRVLSDPTDNPDSSHSVAVIDQQWTARVALTGWAVCTVYNDSAHLNWLQMQCW